MILIMQIQTVRLETVSGAARYEIRVGSDLLREAGPMVRYALPAARKCVIVSNEKVFGLYGDVVEESLSAAGVEPSRFLIPDGEQYKTLEHAARAVESFSSCRLNRGDAVVALGGGVVGDLAGFAASVFMRGIPYFQIPTTLLAMIDSSVGGKTGVNTGFGKNLVGTFHHPAGVLADVSTLKTLDNREFSSGLYEAVKQAALSGREAVEGLVAFLSSTSVPSLTAESLDEGLLETLIGIIAEQVRFKASVVKEDAVEAVGRTDSRSRKVLNFGHTTGHALEKATNFAYFRHGEAVGYGILAALGIAKRLELCPADSIDLLNDVVRSVGTLPDASDISIDQVLNSIEFDKKSSSDSVQWVLLEDIGKPVILSGPDIPPNVIKEAIESALSQHSTI